jgi:hypothetical protein
MRRVDYYKKLNDTGVLKTLLRSGDISVKVYSDLETYLKYDSYIRQGIKKAEAAYLTADVAKINFRTVYKVVKQLESPIEVY